MNFHRYPVFAACPRELLARRNSWKLLLVGYSLRAAQKFRTSCTALISSCLLRLRKTRLPPESPSYHLDVRGNAISDCPKPFATNAKIHYSSARSYVCSLRNSCSDLKRSDTAMPGCPGEWAATFQWHRACPCPLQASGHRIAGPNCTTASSRGGLRGMGSSRACEHPAADRTPREFRALRC